MTPADLEELLRRQESRNVDFKAAGAFVGDFRASLAVAVAAMANTSGGGSLLIGVKKMEGVWTPEGVTPEQLRTFDKTSVVQYMRNFLDPMPSLEIETVDCLGVKVVHFSVREFEDVPIVVKKTIQGEERRFAVEGDLLIRSDAAQSRPIQSADECRQLLGRAISRKSENLLAEIRAVVTGTRPRRLEKAPAEVFEEQLQSWSGEVAAFDEKYAPYARWEVVVLPLPPGEPLEPRLAQMTLRNAKVSYRGWDFPALPMNQDLIFGLDHLEVRTEWQEFREVSQFSYRGGFGFASVFWTDMRPRSRDFSHPEPPDRILDTIGMLYSISEFFRFGVNLAEAFNSENLWLAIRLKGVKNRKLGSFDPRRMWWGDQRSRENEIQLDRLFVVADLKGSWKETARQWAKKVFTVFQWPDPDDAVLLKAQDELVERRR